MSGNHPCFYGEKPGPARAPLIALFVFFPLAEKLQFLCVWGVSHSPGVWPTRWFLPSKSLPFRIPPLHLILLLAGPLWLDMVPYPPALAPCAVSDKSLSELMSWSLLFFPRVLNLSLQSVLSWFIYMMKQREESAFIFLPVNTQISQHCLRIINITHNKYYIQHTYMLYITHTYISTWTCSCQRVTVNMREQFIGVISLSTMWVPGVKLYPSETSH